MTDTPNFGLNRPTIGGDTNNWGELLNDNFTKIDSYLVPTGAILMWSGSIASIPAGWALCDGTNGTPNLRNRFIVGAGDEYTPADEGGAKEVTLTEAQLPAHDHGAGELVTGDAGTHTHTGTTDTEPAHTHIYTRRNFNAFVPSSGNVTVGFIGTNGDPVPQLNTTAAGAHDHSLNVNPAGDHSHTVSGDTADAGGGAAHENRPPYFALAYIMKLAAPVVVIG